MKMEVFTMADIVKVFGFTGLGVIITATVWLTILYYTVKQQKTDIDTAHTVIRETKKEVDKIRESIVLVRVALGKIETKLGIQDESRLEDS